MKQSNIITPSPSLKLAQSFFQALGPAPWELAQGGVVSQVTEKTLPAKLARLMDEGSKRKESIYAVMPSAEGMVQHLAVHSPHGRRKAGIEPPQIVIVADGTTLVWLLSYPVPIAQAMSLTKKLAQGVEGGRPVTGQGVPLPGTVIYKRTGINLTQRIAVQMLPPSRTRYSLVNGQLSKPAITCRTADPRLLTVPLGTDMAGQPVEWRPAEQANGHVVVLGGSGSGKTVTLRRLGAGVHAYGVPVLVLDFHGDVTLPGVRDVLLSSGTDSTRGLNPMEIDAVSSRESGLFDQRGELREMIMRACPALGHRQRNALREAIERAYVNAGILDNDPASWGNPPPTFPGLLELIEDEGLKAGATELFGHPIFGRTDHIGVDELLSRSTRLDLSKLSDGVRFVTAESLLLRIFRVLRNRGPIPINPVDDSERFRLFVVIDEARILAMGGGANILDTLATEARKFGLGMILATQSASHFPNDIRANAATWIVLKAQEIGDAKANAPNIGVEPKAIMDLRGKGDALYRSQATEGAWRIQVKPLS